MWGQVLRLCRYKQALRIIPTRVGTRNSLPFFATASKDHPHACGDKRECSNFLQVLQGSSPRVWGQVSSSKKATRSLRIIPTRVGTSGIRDNACSRAKDHPHACGDKSACFKLAKSVVGSSPRVWGQDIKKAVACDCRRIIPTRVGTRPQRHGIHRRGRDHPHACGDKSVR